jgi:hypothetical protein
MQKIKGFDDRQLSEKYCAQDSCMIATTVLFQEIEAGIIRNFVIRFNKETNLFDVVITFDPVENAPHANYLKCSDSLIHALHYIFEVRNAQLELARVNGNCGMIMLEEAIPPPPIAETQISVPNFLSVKHSK